MSPPTRNRSSPSRVTRSTQNVCRLPSPTVLIVPSMGNGSVRTPQPRTSAGWASEVGLTLTHQLPKSTPMDDNGALYAVSLRSSALQRSDGLAFHLAERRRIDDEPAFHRRQARAFELGREAPQRVIVQRRVAVALQDEVAAQHAVLERGRRQKSRVEATCPPARLRAMRRRWRAWSARRASGALPRCARRPPTGRRGRSPPRSPALRPSPAPQLLEIRRQGGRRDQQARGQESACK